jgi:hypothetical protein
MYMYVREVAAQWSHLTQISNNISSHHGPKIWVGQISEKKQA